MYENLDRILDERFKDEVTRLSAAIEHCRAEVQMAETELAIILESKNMLRQSVIDYVSARDQVETIQSTLDNVSPQVTDLVAQAGLRGNN